MKSPPRKGRRQRQGSPVPPRSTSAPIGVREATEVAIDTPSQPPKSRVRTFLKRAGEILGVIMLSGIVAAMVSVYFTDRANVKLENSKFVNSQKLKVAENFDAAHADVLSKLTLFNADVLSGKKIDPSRRADVIQALVKAQLATNELEGSLLKENDRLAEDYKKELTTISDQVQTVDQPLGLGGVFESVSILLPLHDKIANEARQSLKVEGLF
jgi:hypothetical protein